MNELEARDSRQMLSLATNSKSSPIITTTSTSTKAQNTGTGPPGSFQEENIILICCNVDLCICVSVIYISEQLNSKQQIAQ